MAITNNDAAVRTDSTNAEAGTPSAGEIDLYDELIAFAELSPEEHLQLLDRPEEVSGVTEMTPENAEEYPFPDPVLTTPPIESVEETAPEPAAESVSEARESPASVGSSLVRRDLFDWPGFVERLEAEVTVSAAESASAPEASLEPGKVPFESRPSGPLSDFCLTPDFVFTSALSRGGCLACGAESGVDDLFCMTCGVFIGEIASTLPFNPTCAECKQGIAADEIFCPWCGCSLPE